jgi:S1-C subfamily serine protease
MLRSQRCPGDRTGSGPATLLALALVGTCLGARPVSGAATSGSIDGSIPGARAVGDTLERLAAQATAAVVRIDVRTPTDSRQGSGFLVDSSGRIVTNYHVVRDARSMKVKLASGDVYENVTVLATDERRDVAVLQIPGYKLPALPLGNSDSVRTGTSVVLIGSPMGLENTVSTGIVSGSRQEKEGYRLLQVSAPASPGSSGGPVLTSGGVVIGVAVSQMQAGQNLNFAVPINYVRGLLDHLGNQPATVLAPEPSRPGREASRPLSGITPVNRGLAFALDGFAGYRLDLAGTAAGQRHRQTRVTYRRIETVGGGVPRIERYVESETTEPSGPFGTPQVVSRERERTIVGARDLHPISARGEVAWRGAQGWTRSEYDLRFEGDHVHGVIQDTAGPGRDLDRDLPDGILIRGTLDLAFGTLVDDSLVGRSVEFVAFDPRTGQVTHERFDVQELTTVHIGGRSYRALRVNIASGLSNTTAYFRAESPRVLLRSVGESGREEVTRLAAPGAEGGGEDAG